MNNITDKFSEIFIPQKALILYRSLTENHGVYVEAFDMDEKGFMINAHPLSLQESEDLADTMHTSTELRKEFLKPKGIIPENVLYIDEGKNGYAIWYTKSQRVPLFFKDDLTIPDGVASVPALVWKATKNNVCVYALKGDLKPSLDTPLYYAPFFNMSKEGRVCMGNVNIDFERNCCLEKFMTLWEGYFFNSKFSHLLDNNNPVFANIVQLWQGLIGNQSAFPLNELKPNNKIIKSLII